MRLFWSWPDSRMRWFFWRHEVFGHTLYRLGPINLMIYGK